jgi:hypothetical protein
MLMNWLLLATVRSQLDRSSIGHPTTLVLPELCCWHSFWSAFGPFQRGQDLACKKETKQVVVFIPAAGQDGCELHRFLAYCELLLSTE